MANLPTPALRKKRILRDVCLLLLCPLVLLLAWGFPYFTRSQALWALQKANFFEGGSVVAWSSPPEDRDPAYAVLRREAVEHCFLFPCDGSAWVPVDDPFQSIRLRGYDTAGNLVYESPVPSLWANYDFSPME